METIYFHDSVYVEHLDAMNSRLWKDGELEAEYGPSEVAWQDAERDAYDIAVERMYRS